jgi:hypothetical protein
MHHFLQCVAGSTKLHARCPVSRDLTPAEAWADSAGIATDPQKRDEEAGLSPNAG